MKLLPTAEVAALCGKTPRDIRRWVARGDIPAGPRGASGAGAGNTLLWSPSAVEQAIARSKEHRGHDYNRPGMIRGRGYKLAKPAALPLSKGREKMRFKLAIEVNHQWAQRLPIRDNILECIVCGQVRPILDIGDRPLSCAAMAAWQSYGATADGDFLVRAVSKGE